MAQDYETAFREKFQLPQDGLVDGLTPQELALEHGVSHATVFVRGKLSRVFELNATNLTPLAAVFRRIKMPARAAQIKKKLNVGPRSVFMMQTNKQIYDGVMGNWRVLPIQFELPAQSHILAELIRAAGFEAIAYQSTKGPGRCLAVFPDLLQDGSFIELVDAAPAQVQHRRLDCDSATSLEGWESIPPRLRRR